MSLPKMVRYVSPLLSLCLEKPVEWTVRETEPFPLLLLSPPVEGYSSNLGFSRVSLSVNHPDVFEQVIRNTQRDQQSDYPGFQQLSEQRTFQSGCPLYLQTYQWQDPGRQVKFSQVLGLMVISPECLYEIHGATLSSMAERYLPVLIHVVRSMQVIESTDGVTSD